MDSDIELGNTEQELFSLLTMKETPQNRQKFAEVYNENFFSAKIVNLLLRCAVRFKRPDIVDMMRNDEKLHEKTVNSMFSFSRHENMPYTTYALYNNRKLSKKLKHDYVCSLENSTQNAQQNLRHFEGYFQTVRRIIQTKATQNLAK